MPIQEQEKPSLIENLSTDNCIVIIPAVKLIQEDIETLKKNLTDLGVKIQLSCYPLKKSAQVIVGEHFIGQITDYCEELIILPGIDTLPLYIALEKIEHILLGITSSKEEQVTGIIWKSGGSTNIDKKYFIPLKKYWLKQRQLLVAVNLSDKKQLMIDELSKIDGFLESYNGYLEANKQKTEAARNQMYENAANARDKEKKFLKKANELVGDSLEKVIIKVFEENLHL